MQGPGESEVDSETEEDEELGDLPQEVAQKLEDRRFEDEEELQEWLDVVGIGDLSVILIHGRPRLIVPSHQRNRFSTKRHTHFRNWALGTLGTWACHTNPT